jgi:hypothetical protein
LLRSVLARDQAATASTTLSGDGVGRWTIDFRLRRQADSERKT